MPTPEDFEPTDDHAGLGQALMAGVILVVAVLAIAAAVLAFIW
jgi:hypothetical protein